MLNHRQSTASSVKNYWKIKSSSRVTYFVVFFIIALDQFSKAIFENSASFFCNKSSAFGFTFFAKGDNNAFSALISIFLIFYVLYLFSKSKKHEKLFFALIVGGGASNLLDRFVYGCVRDFIAFYSFPTFNLADAAITIGIFLYIFFIFINRKDA